MPSPTEYTLPLNKAGNEAIEAAREDGNLATIKDRIAGAEAYTVFNLGLGTAKSDETQFGESKVIRWVQVRYYDGDDSDLGTLNQFIKIGGAGDDGIPLLKLIPPDNEVVFEGRITGDVRVTTTAQADKRLVLVVGHE